MRTIKLTVLHLFRLLGLFALARRLTRHELRILCYHGFELEDESSFRPKLFMKPATFERRMRTLAASGLPVLPLDEAVRRLYADQLPACAVTITIDDGFYSVEKVAAPVLRRLNLPSTLYVSTYYVLKQVPIFQVLTQYLLWKSKRREVSFTAAWAPVPQLDLRDAAAVASFTERLVDFGNRTGSEEIRQNIARELAQALEVDFDRIVESRSNSLLSVPELKRLEEQGMAIEMHTHRHRFPPNDPAQCRRELADNLCVLEPALGRRPAHFCYPSGVWQPAHFEPLAEFGVASATTCEPGLNGAQTPRFAMRRFLDSEVIAQIEFDAELSGVMELLRRVRARLFRRTAQPLGVATQVPW